MKEMKQHPDFKIIEVPQHMILAMRLLMAWKEHGTIPMAEMEKGVPEDEDFMHLILSYYS
jgi:hypothetical protein